MLRICVCFQLISIRYTSSIYQTEHQSDIDVTFKLSQKNSSIANFFIKDNYSNHRLLQETTNQPPPNELDFDWGKLIFMTLIYLIVLFYFLSLMYAICLVYTIAKEVKEHESKKESNRIVTSQDLDDTLKSEGTKWSIGDISGKFQQEWYGAELKYTPNSENYSQSLESNSAPKEPERMIFSHIKYNSDENILEFVGKGVDRKGWGFKLRNGSINSDDEITFQRSYGKKELKNEDLHDSYFSGIIVRKNDEFYIDKLMEKYFIDKHEEDEFGEKDGIEEHMYEEVKVPYSFNFKLVAQTQQASSKIKTGEEPRYADMDLMWIIQYQSSICGFLYDHKFRKFSFFEGSFEKGLCTKPIIQGRVFDLQQRREYAMVSGIIGITSNIQGHIIEILFGDQFHIYYKTQFDDRERYLLGPNKKVIPKKNYFMIPLLPCLFLYLHEKRTTVTNQEMRKNIKEKLLNRPKLPNIQPTFNKRFSRSGSRQLSYSKKTEEIPVMFIPSRFENDSSKKGHIEQISLNPWSKYSLKLAPPKENPTKMPTTTSFNIMPSDLSFDSDNLKSSKNHKIPSIQFDETYDPNPSPMTTVKIPNYLRNDTGLKLYPREMSQHSPSIISHKRSSLESHFPGITIGSQNISKLNEILPPESPHTKSKNVMFDIQRRSISDKQIGGRINNRKLTKLGSLGSNHNPNTDFTTIKDNSLYIMDSPTVSPNFNIKINSTQCDFQNNINIQEVNEKFEKISSQKIITRSNKEKKHSLKNITEFDPTKKKPVGKLRKPKRKKQGS